MHKRLFAIGDIHGCFNGFRTLVEQVVKLKKDDKLILLGDYIDRGLRSKEVVDYIMLLLKDGYDIEPLMGNHERLLLDAYDTEDNYYISNWINNGGDATLDSFGVESIKDIEPYYIEFLKGLNYYHTSGEYIFVHAGFNDLMDNPFDDRHSMTWYCSDSYNNPMLKDKYIIHGHCPVTKNRCVERLQSNEKVIDIDTGYVYAGMDGYGNLTALEVYKRQLHFVESS